MTDLDNLSDDALLKKRICDLPLSLEGTWLEECIQQLYKELDARGLVFHPPCYLADEWLTPEGEPVIGIPFYLAHPALTRLERKMMLEAEGEKRDDCLKLLRHEAGHAYAYAYRLHKKRIWQKVFGPSSLDYPEVYRYRPYSKNYVRHLPGFYAQLHPDEDFVETFAVWLTPHRDWKKEYAGWGALKKLYYVDRVMTSIRGRPPIKSTGKRLWAQTRLRSTLKNFYKKKRRFSAEEFPDFYDRALLKIFVSPRDDSPKAEKAFVFLKTYRRHLLNETARWTGERKYVIHDILKAMTKRARQLGLSCPDDTSGALMALTAYVTTLVMNYRHTGWYQGDKRKKRF